MSRLALRSLLRWGGLHSIVTQERTLNSCVNRLFSPKGASNPGLRIRIFLCLQRTENYYNTVATKLCWCYNIVKCLVSERSGVDWEISIILMIQHLQTIRIKLKSLKPPNNFRMPSDWSENRWRTIFSGMFCDLLVLFAPYCLSSYCVLQLFRSSF